MMTRLPSGLWFGAISFVFSLVLVSACQPLSPRVQSSGVADDELLENGAPSQLELVNDVPVPEGAVFDGTKSLVLGRGDRWTGRLVLKLNLPPTQASGLYQNEMPSFGWQALMSIQEGFGVNTYLRGDRIANVRIESLGLRGSRVSVTVALRAPGTPPSAFNPAPDSRTAPTPGIRN